MSDTEDSECSKFVDIVNDEEEREEADDTERLKPVSKQRKRKTSYTLRGLEPDEITELRSKINSRERKRMHDLNLAMDSLREVMPYGKGPSVRKLSKIATLSLARNYIQTLTKSVDDMKRLLDEIYRSSALNQRHQETVMSSPYLHASGTALFAAPTYPVPAPPGYTTLGHSLRHPMPSTLSTCSSLHCSCRTSLTCNLRPSSSSLRSSASMLHATSQRHVNQPPTCI